MALENKNVGVVGGSGYLGRDLALALRAANRVRILDIREPDFLDRSANLSFVRCDVGNADECLSALEGLDIVFHRTGLYGNLPSMKDPARYFEVNVLGTLNVLRACSRHGVRKFLFDSTEFVYGTGVRSPVTEDMRPEPASIYGASKLICEAAIRAHGEAHGLPYVIFRFCRVRDRAKEDVITTLARKVLAGEEVTLLDGGRPAMDFVELADATRACVAAAASDVRNEIFNISSGTRLSLNEMLEAIRVESGAANTRITYRDSPRAPPGAEFHFGAEDLWMSVEKAAKLLGWRPETDLRRSIRGTVQYVSGGRH